MVTLPYTTTQPRKRRLHLRLTVAITLLIIVAMASAIPRSTPRWVRGCAKP